MNRREFTNNIETSDENIRRIYRFLLPVKY